MNDNGIFTFTKTGCSMHPADGEQLIAWTGIVSMIGYKRDYLTSDSICMGIFCENDRGFEITEDMPGWFQF
jgi:hypothetical protein